MDTPRGWYSRGYLPHIDAGSVPQFLTWRLADCLPIALYDEWKRELSSRTDAERKRELYRRVENFLDDGHGCQLLRDPRAAKAVQDTLLYDHGKRYELAAWVIMPTHVHVLLTPFDSVPLAKIVQILKGQSSLKMNKLFGASGQNWQEDYFDRMIRNERHFVKVSQYIEWNPVKAKLCSDPSHWPYSSAGTHGRRVL